MNDVFAWFSQLNWDKLLTFLFTALSCVVCIVFHELCHGLAAYRMGDNTARRAGRLSLNPLKHIDPVGLIMLFTVHFGWAKPVPVDMRRFQNPKVGMALTALAGPAGNLLLALALSPLLAVLQYFYAISNSNFWCDVCYWMYYFLFYTVTLSVGLAVFNLLPIPPLDGSKILLAYLPQQWYVAWMRYERYGMLVLVLLLFLGVLDQPLAVLRDGVLNGLFTLIVSPLCNFLFTLI